MRITGSLETAIWARWASERILRMRIALVLAVTGVLGGCGTYVPSISEGVPDHVTEQQLVQKILQGVTCELRDAVNDFYQKQQRAHLFLDSWGAQLTLTLTVEEKGELNPTAMWMPGMFSLFFGVDLSSDATRIETINSFRTIHEIRDLHSCSSRERPIGPFILQSDLRLEDLLFGSQISADTGQANVGEKGGKNVIQHEVKFLVASSGSITPAWKLSRIWSVDKTGVFMSALRNRTQDLIITLGQLDPTGTALGGPAASLALSAQIGTAVSNGVRPVIIP
jgi:hypothetical protein